MPKRRLPLLPASADADSDDPVRPGWQWVVFGALAIVATWVPLSALTGAIGARVLAHADGEAPLRRAALMTSGAYAVELGIGALAGGYLVGKWGPSHVGPREAVFAGLTAAAVLALATWASFGATPGLALVVVISPVMAGWGAWLGRRGKAPRA
jgi:hypothetical protein